ncbi:TPA: hypothetical protein ACQJOO_004539, partial [Vibrio parahaemolyticus]
LATSSFGLELVLRRDWNSFKSGFLKSVYREIFIFPEHSVAFDMSQYVTGIVSSFLYSIS